VLCLAARTHRPLLLTSFGSVLAFLLSVTNNHYSSDKENRDCRPFSAKGRQARSGLLRPPPRRELSPDVGAWHAYGLLHGQRHADRISEYAIVVLSLGEQLVGAGRQAEGAAIAGCGELRVIVWRGVGSTNQPQPAALSRRAVNRAVGATQRNASRRRSPGWPPRRGVIPELRR
jgi:hypothetical protein